MTRCISCGRLPTEDCNELTHAAHDRMWVSTLLGPQPGPISYCDSCQILVRAVARLAYAIGYDETGDEMTELLEEFGDPGGEAWEVIAPGVPE